MHSIGDHKKSVVDQQNNSDRQSYINSSLKIRIDIIPKSIKRISYLVLASIRSLCRSGIIQRSLLNLIFLICFADNRIENSYRIATIFGFSTILSNSKKRKHIRKNQKRSKNFFHRQDKEINISITIRKFDFFSNFYRDLFSIRSIKNSIFTA